MNNSISLEDGIIFYPYPPVNVTPEHTNS